MLPGQKLCKQCVTGYKKLTKPPKNEKVRETIETESLQDKLVSDDDFLPNESPKKPDSQKHEFFQLISMELPNIVARKLKHVLNVYNENISAAYNVSTTNI